MSGQIVAERKRMLLERNGNGNGSAKMTTRRQSHHRCVAKELYDTPPQSSLFPVQIVLNMFHWTLILMSKVVFGQFLITFFDINMIKIEKTLDFCVPRVSTSEVAENHRNTLTETDRPMSWIFFIPALIFLRFFRFFVSVFSITFGKGEITAKMMRDKIVAFRRYYRSIRHYAVNKYTEHQLKVREERCKSSVWRFLYTTYEMFVMTKPPVEKHANMPDEEETDREKTNKRLVLRSHQKDKKKSSLNQIDHVGEGSSDENLTVQELLEKYGELNENSIDDPDYVPENEGTNDESSSETEVDTEEEKTESQKKLNDNAEGQSANSSMNGYSSDVENREKSKNDSTLSQEQLMELENQLVMKIMKHFKENFNYAPTGDSAEIYYSPIGSPPDKGYNSDSGIISNGKGEERENQVRSSSNQIQEVNISYQVTPADENSEQQHNQVDQAQQ